MSLVLTRGAPRGSTGWRGSLAPTAVAVAAAGVTAFVARVDPNAAGHYPTCPFLYVTGAYCPGCGSLRALHALGHGDVSVALARNPLAVLAAGLLLVLWASWLRRSVSGRPRRLTPAWVIWVGLAVVLVFWVLRNLPGFAWLAP